MDGMRAFRPGPRFSECVAASLSDSNLLRVRVERYDCAVMICLGGDIDASNIDTWRCVLDEVAAATPTPGPLLIDLRHLDFMAVCGFTALARTAQHCARRGIAVRLISTQRAIARTSPPGAGTPSCPSIATCTPHSRTTQHRDVATRYATPHPLRRVCRCWPAPMPPGADPAGLISRHAGPFRAGLRVHHGIAVVDVAGVLDTVTAPTLANHLDAALAARPKLMIVDLSDAVVEGTAAIYVLTEAHRLTQRGALPMRIVAHRGAATTRPLALISTLIELYPTITAATRY